MKTFSKFYGSLNEEQRKYVDRKRDAEMAERKLNETIIRGICLTCMVLGTLTLFGPSLVVLNNNLKK